MKFQEAIDEVEKFNEERGWGKKSKYNAAFLKDFLLNMTEEVGEAWNIVKWLEKEELEQQVTKYKIEFEDFVGDQLYLIFKIAYLLDINPAEAFEKTMSDYDKRFPKDKMKEVKHGNPLAGGIDNKGE